MVKVQVSGLSKAIHQMSCEAMANVACTLGQTSYLFSAFSPSHFNATSLKASSLMPGADALEAILMAAGAGAVLAGPEAALTQH